MKHETYIKLVDALCELAETDMPQTKGVCCFLVSRCGRSVYEETREYLHDAYNRWPLFSGNYEHPVQHPTMDVYGAYHHSNENWNTDTEYGRNRWALVAFLLEDLAKGRPHNFIFPGN